MNTPKRKAAWCSNTLTAIKKTHIENITNAIKSIASYARQPCVTCSFSVNPYAGMGKLENGPERACDSIQAGAEYTTDIAGNPPDSGIFSRPEFAGMGFPVSHGFGRDGANRKAARMAISMYSTSRPPVHRLNNGDLVLQSHIGAETMTTVNTPTTSTPDTIERQHAIEHALESALYFIRLPGTPSALHAATGRANRALTLLKNACTQAKRGSAA